MFSPLFRDKPDLLWAIFLILATAGPAELHAESLLFGYKESVQQSINTLPQWLAVLERHLRLDADLDRTNPGQPRAELIRQWRQLLQSLRDRPRQEQLRGVNAFANGRPYILDSINYGKEDYWAVVKEFLTYDGDCEDFAITKYFSLRLLGFGESELRVVILQDTNLRTAHAVLAVFQDADIFILDNQVKQVLSHSAIVHYTPLYSVNEKDWWIHLPPL